MGISLRSHSGTGQKSGFPQGCDIHAGMRRYASLGRIPAAMDRNKSTVLRAEF
jgi:hypothetical protein